ncbi:MAG: alpha/beta hydrolase [Frankiales bacterium]|nr:alpha/beta hydrolase [Frankiales bacterium]
MSDHDYVGPEGLRTRGTVLIVPGRGETARSYTRFGSRIAADSYRVRVLDTPVLDVDDLEGSLDRLADQVAAAVADLDPVAPLVLIGSDSGAAAVGALVARAEWSPAAVVLAGLPGYASHDAQAWDDELDARTHCTVQRNVLSEDAALQRGALDEALPAALLDAAYGSIADVPHLLLVGDADEYADRDALTRAAKGLPRARLVIVRGGHHDVLNDLQHRSVAAEIITFLESLRDVSSLVPIVSAESSAW